MSELSYPQDAAKDPVTGAEVPAGPAADDVAADAADSGSEDGEADAAADEGASGNAGAGAGLTSKQKKKKKSKAAQKLKKKLGLGSSNNGEESSGAGGSASNQVTPEMLSQVQSAVSQAHGEQAADKVNVKNLQEVLKLMNLERNATLQGQKTRGISASLNQIKDHKFWKTQPVMKADESAPLTPADEGPIQPNAPPEKVKQDPYPLPADFEWVTVDIDDQEELKEVYELLSANYVEDDDASLRFNYSPAFLHWVLKHPGYQKTWHVGVRVVSTKKLVAFISGIPHELRVREKSFHSTEINFLCVHKKLRSKRLAPVLIKEVTRQCHLTGIFQAIYTVGTVLPTPLSCARYYHRTINAEKLLKIGFASVPSGLSKKTWAARYALPEKASLAGLREMTDEDVPQVGKLMRRYLRRFDMAPRFTDEEVRHVLLSGRGGAGKQKVVWTYVIDDPEKPGRITDMASFYSLPSSVLDSEEHKTLNAAYLFYYATDVVFPAEQPSGSEAATASAGTEASSSSSSSSQAAGSSSTAVQGARPMTDEEKSLPAWKRSLLTGLSAEELKDEEGVVRWEDESDEVKRKLTARLKALVGDLMVIAKQNDFDVLNSLTTLDNNLFLNDLKFGPGDGFLRWYLYNWKASPVAGGMGGRPGELELDPAMAAGLAAANASASASAGRERGKDREGVLAGGAGVKTTWMKGSGLGVAMV